MHCQSLLENSENVVVLHLFHSKENELICQRNKQMKKTTIISKTNYKDQSLQNTTKDQGGKHRRLATSPWSVQWRFFARVDYRNQVNHEKKFIRPLRKRINKILLVARWWTIFEPVHLLERFDSDSDCFNFEQKERSKYLSPELLNRWRNSSPYGCLQINSVEPAIQIFDSWSSLIVSMTTSTQHTFFLSECRSMNNVGKSSLIWSERCSFSVMKFFVCLIRLISIFLLFSLWNNVEAIIKI